MSQERQSPHCSSLYRKSQDLTFSVSQFKMKRNPRKLAWTKAFRRAHGKEMTVDSTLAFAARRNVPVRYNRDLVAATLKAMQRVEEVRVRRERQFYRNRMKGNKEREREADRKLVEENQHLLPPEERFVVPEAVAEKAREMEVLEEGVEDMAVKSKKPLKKKQRLVVGHGVEGMDMD